jgi:type II secretory pathway component PulK
MAAIGVLITIVVVGAALVTVGTVVAVIVASVSTTLAVQQEEWLRTLKRPAPSRLAEFVRGILGVYVRRMDRGPDEHRPEEEPPWYERSNGPTRL